MHLSFISRLALCIGLTSTIAFASGVSYTFNGVQSPATDPSTGPSNFLGNTCTPGVLDCVIGDPVKFDIFTATLSQATTNGPWTLTVVTNAPSGNFDGFNNLAFGDALFKYGKDNQNNPIYWGVALGSQTFNGTETAGGLYEENMFNGVDQAHYPMPPGYTSAAGQSVYLTPSMTTDGVTPALPGDSGRNNEPVWINPNNMTLVSTGTPTFSVACAKIGGGTTNALNDFVHCDTASGYGHYTITDVFSAPSGFLDPSGGPFSFEVASYVCANGLIIATTPEPRALFLIVIPVMFLLGRRLTRSRGMQVS